MARWFGPKNAGLSGVRSWQGWLATAIVLAVVLAMPFVKVETWGLPQWAKPAIIFAVVLCYLVLVFAKYGDD